jgi:serine/threonine protein kinase
MNFGKKLGNYRVVSKLGQGGMGAVYCAKDEVLLRDVAIKVLSSRTVAEKSAKDFLLNEARAACALNHPNASSGVLPQQVGRSMERAGRRRSTLRSMLCLSCVPKHALWRFLKSFFPQCHHWVSAHGATRGHNACRQGRNSQHQGDASDDHRVQGVHIVELRSD